MNVESPGPLDKMTIFLTQRADQAHWELRIQQLKSEAGDDQQLRASRDLRNLVGLQVTTPRPSRKADETPRQTLNGANSTTGARDGKRLPLGHDEWSASSVQASARSQSRSSHGA